MKRADGKWDDNHIRSLIDSELAHVTVRPHIEERILQKVRMRQLPLLKRIRLWLNYEIVLTIPQTSAAVTVACLVLGMYWYQATAIYRVDAALLADYQRPMYEVRVGT